ncbi:OmpA family protein [Fibrella aquatilis]|uniref:OmpA family protein n=1 Tax=Fibrella aquatilis TaxID=2817059 RepID=A0A939K108_9BACT|nr:OmpA family protein [Fibrella aquatilis]MBO0934749.1 OmpA family protein [Fibrella aquatilis]
MRWLLRSCVWILLFLSGYSAMASPQQRPDSLLLKADRMLSYRAYGRAIDLYQQALNGKNLTPVQRASAQASLAQAYRSVGDNVKAEAAFREWMTQAAANNESASTVLAYAQTLASNGKFAEADVQFSRYQTLKEQQRSRIPASIPTAADGRPAATRREAVRYQIDDLSLNTGNEEFSPMFYQNGLVYVSGSKGGSTIETSGSGGGAGYLDLIYIPDRNQLTSKQRYDADGELMKGKAAAVGSGAPSRTPDKVGKDFYTQATANDNKTAVGFDAGIRVAEGLGYDDKQGVDPSKRFSQSLNTRYHEGPSTFSADGTQIIFTRNNYNNGKAKTSAENVNKLKLYTARQVDGAWTDVVELPFNSDEYSVGHPALGRGPDGTPDQLLFFASDMPGGLGGTDLYVTRWLNGRWSEPQNLGPTINTKGNELFPFSDDKGNLYYSTDGRKGLGGLDVFYAAMAGTTVRSVETIDAPINSPGDDFGLITDGTRHAGFLSSNRNGSDDIFRFTRESSLYGCRDLTLRVIDREADMPLDSVTVLAKSRRPGQTDQVLTVDANGIVRFCLDGDSDYLFTARRDGYINSTIGFSTKAMTDDQPSQLEMTMLKPTMIIDTVYTETKTLAPLDPKKPLTRSRLRGAVLGEGDSSPIEGVTVKLKNECNGDILSTVTGPDGGYEFDLVEGCDYTLIASKPTYGTNFSRVRKLAKKSKPKLVAADVKLLRVGEVIPMDNIYYDLGNATIRTDAAREIDRLVSTMQKYPSLVIEIRSHTDSRGEAARNRELSTRRARAVADYLASKGVRRNRILATGYGESLPVNNCTDGVICTESEHQRNRRTEFKILSIK